MTQEQFNALADWIEAQAETIKEGPDGWGYYREPKHEKQAARDLLVEKEAPDQ